MRTKKTVQDKKDMYYPVKSGNLIATIKDVDLSKRIVTGLYNTYNYFDSDYDVLLLGSSKKSISERGPNSSAVAKIKHLANHDWTQLPGKIQVLEEREVDINGQLVSGIYFETKMSNNTLGNDTLISYQDEVIDNHSIGFQYMDGEYMDDEAEDWGKMISTLINPQEAVDAGYGFFWKEIMLYEGSNVAFGANDLTPFLGMKSFDNKNALLLKLHDKMDLLHKQLRTGTQSDETMVTFEMQIKQIKQIMSELFTKEPSTKPTRQGRDKKGTQKNMITCSSCTTEFETEGMSSDSDGRYTCPNCSALSKSKTEGVNFKQLLNCI